MHVAYAHLSVTFSVLGPLLLCCCCCFMATACGKCRSAWLPRLTSKRIRCTPHGQQLQGLSCCGVIARVWKRWHLTVTDE